MTAEKILALARAQIGITEQPAKSNNVLYNTAYYGRDISGSNYAWCAVFLWWLFRECGAEKLYFDSKKTAYCPTLLGFHIRQKQQVEDEKYEAGDIVFFNFKGKTGASHVGICERFDGEYITTIDGNTGTGNDANGGAVMRRRRHKKYIVGGYRPDYEKTALKADEEETMDQKQFDQMMANFLGSRAIAPCSDWAVDALEKAVELGITDGQRPQSFATRQEVTAMIINALTGGAPDEI